MLGVVAATATYAAFLLGGLRLPERWDCLPGTTLSAIAESEDVGKLVDIILKGSTNLGVRASERRGLALRRCSEVVSTALGRLM